MKSKIPVSCSREKASPFLDGGWLVIKFGAVCFIYSRQSFPSDSLINLLMDRAGRFARCCAAMLATNRFTRSSSLENQILVFSMSPIKSDLLQVFMVKTSDKNKKIFFH